MNEIDGAPGTIRTSDPQIRSLMVRQRGRRSKDHECVLPALAIAIRPICTPQLPSGHTRALYFFLAGRAYDLITADHHGSGAGMDRRKMPHVVKAVARTEACRRPGVQYPLQTVWVAGTNIVRCAPRCFAGTLREIFR